MTEATLRKGGRPSRMTPELEQQILKFRRHGGKYVNAPDEIKAVSYKTIERLFKRNGISRGNFFKSAPLSAGKKKLLDNPVQRAFTAILNEMVDRGYADTYILANLLGTDVRTIPKMLDGEYDFTLSQLYRCSVRFEGSPTKFIERVLGYEG